MKLVGSKVLKKIFRVVRMDGSFVKPLVRLPHHEEIRWVVKYSIIISTETNTYAFIHTLY